MALKGETVSTIESRHSTTTPLTGNATFTGTPAVDMGTFVSIVASVLADQDGTLYVDSSPDEGAHWDYSVSQAVTANTQAELRVCPPYQYVRVRYVNGSSAQGSMRLQTTLRTDAQSVGGGVSAPGGAALATAAKQDTGNSKLADIYTRQGDGNQKAQLVAGTAKIGKVTEQPLTLAGCGQTTAAASAAVATGATGAGYLTILNTSDPGGAKAYLGTGTVDATKFLLSPGASVTWSVADVTTIKCFGTESAVLSWAFLQVA